YNVHSARLENRFLESCQSRAQLFVRPAVDAPTNRSQKGVQRKADDAVFGGACFVVAVKELNVDVLVESARQPIAGARQHAPAATALGREGNRRVLGGVAQSENRQRFQRPVEYD